MIQRKELVESVAADRVALVPWPTSASLTLPKAALAMYTQDKNLDGAPWLIHRILDHYLKDDDQFEILLKSGPNFEATWVLCNKVPEEAISR